MGSRCMCDLQWGNEDGFVNNLNSTVAVLIPHYNEEVAIGKFFREGKRRKGCVQEQNCLSCFSQVTSTNTPYTRAEPNWCEKNSGNSFRFVLSVVSDL
jgi:hypothetical protein